MVYWGSSGSRNKENKKTWPNPLDRTMLSIIKQTHLSMNPLAGVCFVIRNLTVLQAPLPKIMEYRGFEPLASTMRMLRAPNCANTPVKIISYWLCYYSTSYPKMKEKITNFWKKYRTKIKKWEGRAAKRKKSKRTCAIFISILVHRHSGMLLKPSSQMALRWVAEVGGDFTVSISWINQ